jgi:phytoene dehydrogenase-like protein
MSDGVCDALVVGGGHHGLIVASLPAKGRMKTAIFETDAEAGWGGSQRPGPLPGFTYNPRAIGRVSRSSRIHRLQFTGEGPE